MARVIFAGTYDRDFNRNRRLQMLLETAGHEVEACNVELWGSTRYDIMGQRKLQMLTRGMVAYPRLVWRFLRMRKADVVFAMFPGWFDIIVLAPLARLRGLPLVFDPFISLYDTAVADRKVVADGSAMGRISKLVDRCSMRWSTLVLADTPEHAEYYRRVAGLEENHVRVVRLGAQDDIFMLRPDVTPVPRRVLFTGTLINLQGIETILRAAKLVEADGIPVRIIGSGQEQPLLDALMAELRPTNVELVGRVPVEQIALEMASATLCLGIFGTGEKTRRVVPNKVFECAAVGRPVITADTEAIRGAFSDSEVALVPPGDPEALAAEIRRLIADDATRESLARAAHDRYQREYSVLPLSRVLDEQVRRVLPRH